MRAKIVHEGGIVTVEEFNELEQRLDEQDYPCIRVWYEPRSEKKYTDYYGATITGVRK